MKKSILLTISLSSLFALYTIQSNIAPRRSWTYMVYIAAANDLEIFAPRNIRQMQQIGSNERINIIVHHTTHEKKIGHGRTYFIEKGDKKIISHSTPPVDAGNPQTLIDFCCSTIAAYPADHYALILWNHGSGILEPSTRGHEILSFIHPSSYFSTPTRKLATLPLCATYVAHRIKKGMCFNHYTGTFLSEEDLCNALETICNTALEGKKLDLLGFDACLMSMLEVAYAMHPYAKIMVASQDVERGTGWDYYYALYPFKTMSATPEQLGIHIARAYEKAYKKTPDYTQSCINLEKIPALTCATSHVAFLLHKLLTCNDCPKARTIFKLSRNKRLCTHFDEPDFIDLAHFYNNLLSNIEQIPSRPETPVARDLVELKNQLITAQDLLSQAVLENKTGPAYPQAKGIAIYFPEHAVHASYKKCLFARSTHWISFLKTHLSAPKK